MSMCKPDKINKSGTVHNYTLASENILQYIMQLISHHKIIINQIYYWTIFFLEKQHL